MINPLWKADSSEKIGSLALLSLAQAMFSAFLWDSHDLDGKFNYTEDQNDVLSNSAFHLSVDIIEAYQIQQNKNTCEAKKQKNLLIGKMIHLTPKIMTCSRL